MLVKDVMTSDVRTCPPEATVATAARIMSASECGIVPVVDARRRLVGVVTDRDLCLALGGRVREPGALPISDVMTRTVYSCSANEDPAFALKVMRRHLVRRLPVVDPYGSLVGVLSIDDLVARTGTAADSEIAPEAVLETLKSLAAHTVSR
jgi:CBS domain-containing protein